MSLNEPLYLVSVRLVELSSLCPAASSDLGENTFN